METIKSGIKATISSVMVQLLALEQSLKTFEADEATSCNQDIIDASSSDSDD